MCSASKPTLCEYEVVRLDFLSYINALSHDFSYQEPDRQGEGEGRVE
jgi:hypothetical protein